MKKLFLIMIVALFIMGFAWAQEKGKSPMYYKGVDAGMSPEEVVKVLGEPTRTSESEEMLSYYYMFDDGSSCSFFFHKKKWLCNIYISISPAAHFKEFGLTEEGGQGFETKIFDIRAKIWSKTVDTEKFGYITITYGANPEENFSYINRKSISIIDPSIFEK